LSSERLGIEYPPPWILWFGWGAPLPARTALPRRLHDKAFNSRIIFLERCSAAGKRPARTDKVAERIDAASRLLQNLTRGVEIVCPKITAVMELVCSESAPLKFYSGSFPVHKLKVSARYLTVN